MLLFLSLRSAIISKVLVPVLVFVAVAVVDPFDIERTTELMLDRVFQRVAAGITAPEDSPPSTSVVLLWTDRSGHPGRAHWPLRTEEIVNYLRRVARGGRPPGERTHLGVPVVFLDLAMVTGRCPDSLLAEDAGVCPTPVTNPCRIDVNNGNYRLFQNYRRFDFNHGEGYGVVSPNVPGNSLLLLGTFPTVTEFGRTARLLQVQASRRLLADYLFAEGEERITTLPAPRQDHPLFDRLRLASADDRFRAYAEREASALHAQGAADRNHGGHQTFPLLFEDPGVGSDLLSALNGSVGGRSDFEAELMRDTLLPCLNDSAGTVDITLPVGSGTYPLWNIHDDPDETVGLGARNKAGHIVTITPALAMLDLYCSSLDDGADRYRGCRDVADLLEQADEATESADMVMQSAIELHPRGAFWDDDTSARRLEPPMPWCLSVPPIPIGPWPVEPLWLRAALLLAGSNADGSGAQDSASPDGASNGPPEPSGGDADQASDEATVDSEENGAKVLCQDLDVYELLSLAYPNTGNPQLLGEVVAGRPVFVGFDTSFDLDRHIVPAFDNTPGVVMHAMAFEQLLEQGADYKRPADALLITLQAVLLTLVALFNVLIVDSHHAPLIKHAGRLQTLVAARKHAFLLQVLGTKHDDGDVGTPQSSRDRIGLSILYAVNRHRWLYRPVRQAILLGIVRTGAWLGWFGGRSGSTFRSRFRAPADDLQADVGRLKTDIASIAHRLYRLDAIALLISLLTFLVALSVIESWIGDRYIFASWPTLISITLLYFFWGLIYFTRHVAPGLLLALGVVGASIWVSTLGDEGWIAAASQVGWIVGGLLILLALLRPIWKDR